MNVDIEWSNAANGSRRVAEFIECLQRRIEVLV
jgi:hypothetical protein